MPLYQWGMLCLSHHCISIFSFCLQVKCFHKSSGSERDLYSEFSFTQEPFRPTASCFRKTTWSMLTRSAMGRVTSTMQWPIRTTEVIWNGNIVVLIFRCFSYRCQISRLWESGVSFLWWPRKNFRWGFFVFLSGNIEVSPLFMSCEAVVYTRGKGAVALIHQCVVHSGSNRWHNGPDVTVDYMSTDSLTKWNSYQNILHCRR